MNLEDEDYDRYDGGARLLSPSAGHGAGGNRGRSGPVKPYRTSLSVDLNTTSTKITTPKVSIDLGMLSRSSQELSSGCSSSGDDGSYESVPFLSMPSGGTSGFGGEMKSDKQIKKSQSCEPLCYENVDHNSLDSTVSKPKEKQLRESVSQSSVRRPKSLVHDLVRQYETNTPRRSFSNRAKSSSVKREPVKKTKSLSEYPSAGDALYESACTYEAITGYESVTLQETLQSLLQHESAVVATSQ